MFQQFKEFAINISINWPKFYLGLPYNTRNLGLETLGSFFLIGSVNIN